MEKLAREKINAQQRLAQLKKEISSQYDNIDFAKILPDVPPSSQPSPEPKTEQHHLNNERVPIPPLSRSQVQFSAVNGTKDVSIQTF